MSDEKWAEIEALIPIACVDALPWLRLPSGELRVCLIRRLDEVGAARWNLVGGRVHLDETIAGAVRRHMHETLGQGVTWAREDFSLPEVVGEYMRIETQGSGFDPRHHAIALSYTFEFIGDISISGEALDYGTFPLASLPLPNDIGFRQDSVIYRLADAARAQAATSRRRGF